MQFWFQVTNLILYLKEICSWRCHTSFHLIGSAVCSGLCQVHRHWKLRYYFKERYLLAKLH